MIRADMGRCPKCKEVDLSSPDGRASRLLRCESCKGTWLPKDEARLEAVAGLLSADSTIRPGGSEDQRTGLCPEGHGILIRTRVALDEPFHLERCPECHGIWFDKGEWNCLAQSHLLDHIDRLWDPAVRFLTSSHDDPRAALVKALDEPTVAMIETIATALRDRPESTQSAALAYIERQLRS